MLGEGLSEDVLLRLSHRLLNDGLDTEAMLRVTLPELKIEITDVCLRILFLCKQVMKKEISKLTAKMINFTGTLMMIDVGFMISSLTYAFSTHPHPAFAHAPCPPSRREKGC